MMSAAGILQMSGQGLPARFFRRCLVARSRSWVNGSTMWAPCCYISIVLRITQLPREAMKGMMLHRGGHWRRNCSIVPSRIGLQRRILSDGVSRFSLFLFPVPHKWWSSCRGWTTSEPAAHGRCLCSALKFRFLQITYCRVFQLVRRQATQDKLLPSSPTCARNFWRAHLMVLAMMVALPQIAQLQQPKGKNYAVRLCAA
mmetsp:Transcript_84168/g.212259  ORF Transcript_84168/g.212259 Transcript_84168/m.212259 type:complete len:200 (+) Transcript_84168:258-857(+)